MNIFSKKPTPENRTGKLPDTEPGKITDESPEHGKPHTLISNKNGIHDVHPRNDELSNFLDQAHANSRIAQGIDKNRWAVTDKKIVAINEANDEIEAATSGSVEEILDDNSVYKQEIAAVYGRIRNIYLTIDYLKSDLRKMENNKNSNPDEIIKCEQTIDSLYTSVDKDLSWTDKLLKFQNGGVPFNQIKNTENK